MSHYSHTLEIKSRNGSVRSVVVQKVVPKMTSARDRMKLQIQADSRSAGNEYNARASAGDVLRAARAQLDDFGSPARYRDAIEAKSFPTQAEKARAVKVAQAAANVETRTLELESILKEEASGVARIERAQGELETARKVLESALSARASDRAERQQPPHAGQVVLTLRRR